MIKRIQIENFKSFGKVDLVPHPRVNLLIGPNSSGKSNFLEALQYTSNFADEASIRSGFQVFNKSANTNFDSNSNQKIVLDLDGPGLADSQKGLSLLYNLDRIIIEKEGFENSFILGFQEKTFLQADQHLLAGLGVNFTGIEPGYLQVFHSRFSAFLKFYKPSVSKIRKGRPLEIFKKFEDDLSNLVFYLDFIRDKNIELWNAFSEQLFVITSEYKFITKEITEHPNGEKMVELLFHTDKGAQLAPHEVSDGIIIFAAILAVLSQPNPPKVILLEEPENGIHPRRLSEIISLIWKLAEEKDVQFFITTHSPVILDQFSGDPDCVWIFDKKNGITEIQNLEKLIEAKHVFAKENGLPEIDYTAELSENWLWGFLNGVPDIIPT